MRTMTAYRLTGWQRPPELVEVPVPEPGHGQVLVRVAGVGLCHTDVHFLEVPAGTFDYRLPFTLGHEIAGWVAACGPGVDDLAEGDAVVVSAHRRCGVCEFCLRGQDNYCTASREGLGYGLDGGLAAYVVVDRLSLIGPTTLDPRQAGPLADAGNTSYHAVRRALPALVPGATAVVIGVGGLGGYAVQYLKLLSPARVVAVDTSQARLRRAADLGADVTVLASDALGTELAALLPGGAHAVFDFVGTDATMATALRLSRPLGVLALVGAGGGTAPVSWRTVARECQVFIPQGGTMADLAEVVALAESGRLRLDNELFGFDRVEEAYARLRAGDLLGRAVVLPNE